MLQWTRRIQRQNLIWSAISGEQVLQPSTPFRHIPQAGMILGLRPANERRRYTVTPSLIGWAQTQNQPCPGTVRT